MKNIIARKVIKNTMQGCLENVFIFAEKMSAITEMPSHMEINVYRF